MVQSAFGREIEQIATNQTSYSTTDRSELDGFSTDDSFVKHHCSTDCSALAEEFHGTVMKKQIKQYCTYQTDVKIVNKRLSQSKICDSLCCFLT